MDHQTHDAYEENAESFAEDWFSQPPPDDMYALLKRYFVPGLSADIGCGAGRDVAWLNENGFDAIGFEPSKALRRLAHDHYPLLSFRPSALPVLNEIGNGAFANVLCETVIMHLDPSLVTEATRRLIDITAPGGTLYLSWRITNGESQRDKFDRLYAAFDERLVVDAFVGHKILFDEVVTSVSSGKTIHRIIVRKT